MDSVINVNFSSFKVDNIKTVYENIYMFVGEDTPEKQSLLKQLLDKRENIKSRTCLTSETSVCNDMYNEYFGAENITKEYDTELFANVKKEQSEKIKAKQKEYEEQKDVLYAYMKSDDLCHTILIDNNFPDEFYNDNNIKTFFMNGKCYRTSVIMNSVSPLPIHPAWRLNIDYIFVSRLKTMKDKMDFYSRYGGVFPTFEQFCIVYNNFAERNEIMVIDNSAKSKKMEDIVFWC